MLQISSLNIVCDIIHWNQRIIKGVTYTSVKEAKKKNSSQIHGKAKRESLFYKQTNENTIKPEK